MLADVAVAPWWQTGTSDSLQGPQSGSSRHVTAATFERGGAKRQGVQLTAGQWDKKRTRKGQEKDKNGGGLTSLAPLLASAEKLFHGNTAIRRRSLIRAFLWNHFQEETAFRSVCV